MESNPFIEFRHKLKMFCCLFKHSPWFHSPIIHITICCTLDIIRRTALCRGPQDKKKSIKSRWVLNLRSIKKMWRCDISAILNKELLGMVTKNSRRIIMQLQHGLFHAPLSIYLKVRASASHYTRYLCWKWTNSRQLNFKYKFCWIL